MQDQNTAVKMLKLPNPLTEDTQMPAAYPGAGRDGEEGNSFWSCVTEMPNADLTALALTTKICFSS